LRKFPWNALKDDTISVQNSQGREESSSLAMSSFPGHQIRHERPKRRSHLELEVIGFGSVTEMPVSKLGMTSKQPQVNPLHAPADGAALALENLA
jgi:hypothetical protein